ncbi:MAG: LemA family protein [Odoribacter sp.]|nr:LemA family protein [Odoribacter sp.]
MITLIILIVLVLFFISTYNNLVRKKNNVDNAFGSIDAMLKKRFDLIPNLVATVQQYAKHEEQTFTAITNLRTHSYENLNAREKAEFDRNFTTARRNLFAVAENYPQLKASENFIQLQRTLNETEEQLSASRRTYNACVTEYNNAVMTFPSNLLAGMFGFTRKEVFAIPEAERTNPNVKDLFKV